MEALLLSSSMLKVDHLARGMRGRREGSYATLGKKVLAEVTLVQRT